MPIIVWVIAKRNTLLIILANIRRRQSWRYDRFRKLLRSLIGRNSSHRHCLRVPFAATGDDLPSAAAFEVTMFKPSLATIALFAASQTALAQQPPPGAGGQLQQIPPPPAPQKATPDIRI